MIKRIHIIGSAGTGKTRLAAEAAQRLNFPHIELDDLHWEENWQEAELEVFIDRVRRAVAENAWVADGNYSKVRDIVWARVQQVVWLDYPLCLAFWRLLRRSLRRMLTRELLWGRNRESFRGLFLSGDSLILYLIRTHRSRRKRYQALVEDPDYQSIEFVRLRSPRLARQWLDSLV